MIHLKLGYLILIILGTASVSSFVTYQFAVPKSPAPISQACPPEQQAKSKAGPRVIPIQKGKQMTDLY